MAGLKSLWPRLRYTWQRVRRGYGDDEIDWERRAEIARETQAEMEAMWGPGLVGLREHAQKVRQRWEIANDGTLTELEKLAKIQAILPDTTAEQLKALLVQAEGLREEELFSSDPAVSFEEKRLRLRAAHPDATDEQIGRQIASYTKQA